MAATAMAMLVALSGGDIPRSVLTPAAPPAGVYLRRAPRPWIWERSRC